MWRCGIKYVVLETNHLPLQEEKFDLEKNIEILLESEQQIQYLMDSQFQQSFQNQPSYSPFQEEPNDLEKSMKDMIQIQNFVTQSIKRLEAQMSKLVNTDRNEKTLSYQYLTNHNISNPIDLAQESCGFEN